MGQSALENGNKSSKQKHLKILVLLLLQKWEMFISALLAFKLLLMAVTNADRIDMDATCVPCCILVADNFPAIATPIYHSYRKKCWQLQHLLFLGFLALDLILSSGKGLILVKWLKFLPSIGKTDKLTWKIFISYLWSQFNLMTNIHEQSPVSLGSRRLLINPM